METTDYTTMDLGSLIDALYAARAARLEAEKEIKAMKTTELELKVSIMQKLEAAGLDGAKGKGATAAVIYEELPAVKDWDALYQFIEANEAFDLLQRRVSTTAIRDRWSNGVEVPGVEKFYSTDLSLTKRSK